MVEYPIKENDNRPQETFFFCIYVFIDFQDSYKQYNNQLQITIIRQDYDDC